MPQIYFYKLVPQTGCFRSRFGITPRSFLVVRIKIEPTVSIRLKQTDGVQYFPKPWQNRGQSSWSFFERGRTIR